MLKGETVIDVEENTTRFGGSFWVVREGQKTQLKRLTTHCPSSTIESVPRLDSFWCNERTSTLPAHLGRS